MVHQGRVTERVMGVLSDTKSRQMGAYLLMAMCVVTQVVELDARALSSTETQAHLRGLRFLVQEPTILTYHNGPILTGTTSIPVYIIWYGNFSDAQRSVVLDFFVSTQASNCTDPSVASWWKVIGGYKAPDGSTVPPAMNVQGQLSDECSLGKTILKPDLLSLVTGSLTTFPVDSTGIYLILTADDVVVEEFCKSECASHYATPPTATTKGVQLPYGWVGNPATQCAGKCSWPYAQPEYGPNALPLLPPNGDAGIDGLVINMASILAGISTNPFDNGFYQGDGAAPLEAATACTGIFGPGAYSGYAGELLSDQSTGVSFNAWGLNGRQYLLPALWDPTSTNCTTPL